MLPQFDGDDVKHGVILEILTGGKRGSSEGADAGDAGDYETALDDIEASGVKLEDREKFLAGMKALVAKCMEEYEAPASERDEGGDEE